MGSSPIRHTKRGRGGMVDTEDLKSFTSNSVRVQVPPSLPFLYYKDTWNENPKVLFSIGKKIHC